MSDRWLQELMRNEKAVARLQHLLVDRAGQNEDGSRIFADLDAVAEVFAIMHTAATGGKEYVDSLFEETESDTESVIKDYHFGVPESYDEGVHGVKYIVKGVQELLNDDRFKNNEDLSLIIDLPW